MKMPPNAAFHLGLHCLPKCLFSICLGVSCPQRIYIANIQCMLLFFKTDEIYEESVCLACRSDLFVES